MAGLRDDKINGEEAKQFAKNYFKDLKNLTDMHVEMERPMTIMQRRRSMRVSFLLWGQK